VNDASQLAHYHIRIPTAQIPQKLVERGEDGRDPVGTPCE
jgi:hypothetical protein